MKKEPIEMSKEELTEFLINQGLFQMTHNIGGVDLCHWKTPVITLIDPSRKYNTIFISYSISRISDGLTIEYRGQIDFKDCNVWTKERGSNKSTSRDFRVKDFNYLIEHGYKLPLLDYKND